MGKQFIIIPRLFGFILLLWGAVFTSSLSAQVVQSQQEAEMRQAECQQAECAQTKWKGGGYAFMGSVSFASIGINLKPTVTFPEGEYASPLIGPRVQFGVNFDTEDSEPMWLVVELSRGQNVDKDTKSQLKSATILDIGFEYPSLYLRNRKHNQFTVDYGLFASMCSLQGAGSESLTKWGVSGSVAFAYRHKTRKGLAYGVKLYDHFGKYFGKNKTGSALRFSYANDFGLGAMIYF